MNLEVRFYWVLCWLAASDGSIDEAEARQLTEIATAAKYGQDIRLIIELAQNRDLDALQLAAEIVRAHFSQEKAQLFLEMAIGIAIADGYLLPSENYILRFIADLLGVSTQRLNELFITITGRDIPEPSDPSRADYWTTKEKASSQQQSHEESNGSNSRTSFSNYSERTARAFAVLGLEIGASKEDIRQAYRRLARIHHPDRFTSLGDEAVAAATLSFQRIQTAYDYLMRNA